MVSGVQAKKYLIYPINDSPFEADSILQVTDSVAIFSQLGTRVYSWDQLMQIKDDEGEIVQRLYFPSATTHKQEEFIQKNSNVIMRPVTSYPMKWISIPSAFVLSFGIYEIIQSKKHFRNARNLEKDGLDPTGENNSGNRTRSIGFASSFIGIAGVIISFTPRTTLKPYFTYNHNQSIQYGITYEISVLAFRH